MADSINILKIFIGAKSVGRMVISSDRLCVFEYDPEFVSTGFSISPFYLPLRPGTFTARREPFEGLFGVFNDSLPDGWGNLLIDRYLASQGIQSQSLSVIDRLSIVGSSGMGAIQYKPDKHIRTKHDIDDLNILATEIEKVLSEVDYTGSLDILAEKGGSSGGARPKVFVTIKGKPWLVKFPSSYDQSDIGRIEYNYSVIAKKCGIEMPETALLEGKYFGVQRFDRDGKKRIHMHTASGLLYASHQFPSLDYIDLIKATLALTKDIGEAYKMFRLMVFNILTGNKDDHAKNFSFIYNSGKWKLSPAYDLTPNSGFNGNHSSTVAGKGNPSLEDIYEVAGQCGLKSKITKRIFEEIYDNCVEIRVGNWP
ncbi:MAG: type II toxin-antitoxin system HipA family toxin [Chlorobi bacterium]|nr:type II toxin-antitoxin system HipA family toxin [Chlorobiota bacterium]